MATYLLTWNPRRWPWSDLDDEIRELQAKGYVDSNWSSGNNKSIRPGDRFFLLRQGPHQAGIMGAGQAISDVFEDTHFDKERPNDTALYVDIRFDALLNPVTAVLPRDELSTGHLADVNWNTQASGIRIKPEAALELEAKWKSYLFTLGLEPAIPADEVSVPEAYFEGATTRVSVNRYERSAQARRECVEHYGARCSVCSLAFEERYGGLGRGFIHVHHVVPLSSIGKDYKINPISDLRPVCPNCHAMLHRAGNTLDIEALRETIERSGSKRDVDPKSMAA